jgi:hypothetical protein
LRGRRGPDNEPDSATITVGERTSIGMIEEVVTGLVISTEVRPVEPNDFRRLDSGWRFNWLAAVESAEVFKLVDPSAPGFIFGLLSLRRCKGYIEVTLVESHPLSVGQHKRFRGIAGSLFAFAAQLSFELGGEGFIVIDAKTELFEHYNRTYGFERLGHSQRMILTTGPAARLIQEYAGRQDHE